jgi:hypothetical protein
MPRNCETSDTDHNRGAIGSWRTAAFSSTDLHSYVRDRVSCRDICRWVRAGALPGSGELAASLDALRDSAQQPVF